MKVKPARSGLATKRDARLVAAEHHVEDAGGDTPASTTHWAIMLAVSEPSAAGFKHDGVAGDERGAGRSAGQRGWEIEGTDDAPNAVGLEHAAVEVLDQISLSS